MIHPLRDQDRLQVIQWIRASYWGGWQSEEQVRAGLKHSLVFGAYRNAEDGIWLVGFIRIVTDYATFSAITDLYVDEPHRRQGHARRLLDHVMRDTCVPETICILNSREARGLYAKFGFREIGGNCMQRDPSR